MSDTESKSTTILSQEELEQNAAFIVGGKTIESLPPDDLDKLITFSQYVTDRCLTEIERRGELEFDDGVPVIPYCSDHVIETVLTRDVEAPPQMTAEMAGGGTSAPAINTLEMLRAGTLDLSEQLSAMFEEFTTPTPLSANDLPTLEDMQRVLAPFAGRLLSETLVAEINAALHAAFPSAWPEAGKRALRDRLQQLWFARNYPEIRMEQSGSER